LNKMSLPMLAILMTSVGVIGVGAVVFNWTMTFPGNTVVITDGGNGWLVTATFPHNFGSIIQGSGSESHPIIVKNIGNVAKPLYVYSPNLPLSAQLRVFTNVGKTTIYTQGTVLPVGQELHLWLDILASDNGNPGTYTFSIIITYLII